jgi:hypothetical protein
MRKHLRVPFVVASFAFLAVAASAGENWVGNWKLNESKSKLSGTGVRATSLMFEATPEGIKMTSDGKDAEGKPVHGSFTSKFDGKDVAYTGNPMADTASPKKVDDNNYENTWKKGGKATVTAKVSVSADGKTLTVSQVGKDPEGKPVNLTAVYDKQ